MTAETLNGYSTKVLAEMAKNRGVRGWHSMRKDQLVKSLLKVVRQKTNEVEGPRRPRDAHRACRRSRTQASPSTRQWPAGQGDLANAQAVTHGSRVQPNAKPLVPPV